jgi:hypothetical protein
LWHSAHRCRHMSTGKPSQQWAHRCRHMSTGKPSQQWAHSPHQCCYREHIHTRSATESLPGSAHASSSLTCLQFIHSEDCTHNIRTFTAYLLYAAHEHIYLRFAMRSHSPDILLSGRPCQPRRLYPRPQQQPSLSCQVQRTASLHGGPHHAADGAQSCTCMHWRHTLRP